VCCQQLYLSVLLSSSSVLRRFVDIAGLDRVDEALHGVARRAVARLEVGLVVGVCRLRGLRAE
jgi:hypothetical protein